MLASVALLAACCLRVAGQAVVVRGSSSTARTCTVPAGVTAVDVKLWGAAGRSGQHLESKQWMMLASGGSGAAHSIQPLRRPTTWPASRTVSRLCSPATLLPAHAAPKMRIQKPKPTITHPDLAEATSAATRPRRRPSRRPSGQSSLVASHSTTHRSASEPHPSDPSALSDSVPSALYLVAATYQLSRGLLRCAANRRPKIPSLISFLPTPLVSGPFLSMSCPQFRPPHTCTYACTMVPWTMSIGHSLGFMMKAHPLPPARPIATQPPARVPPSLLTGRACCAPLLAA